MTFKNTFVIFLVATTALSSFPQAVFAQQSYPKEASAVLELAEMAAKDTVKNVKDAIPGNDATPVQMRISSLLFYTVADALGLDTGLGMSLETYQFLGETARTDKQNGTSAKAEGSTSLTEKPGFAQLLGFAVEHGAIKQTIDGTTLTLSTSPYAFLALINRQDTIGLYESAGILNRIGMSASFNLADEDMPLVNVSRKQLTEWSVRARLTGDRSSRSPAFREFWATKIRPILQKRLDAQSRAISEAIDNEPKIDELRTRISGIANPSDPLALPNQVVAYAKAHADDEQGVKDKILSYLHENVYKEIQRLPTAEKEPLAIKVNELLAAIVAAQKNISEAEDAFKTFLKELEKKPLSTLAYTNHRVEMGSDYSEVKFLFEKKEGKVNLTANAALSLYNNPNRMMNQERVRDFSFALSLEGEAKSPFARAEDLSKLTYSFSGSYQRMKENEGMMGRQPDIGNAQFRVEFPVTAGFSIPVAYTYATATEMSNKKENRFNVGLRLDLDKLYALARLNRR